MSDGFSEFGSVGDFEECPPDVECPVGFDILRAPSKGSLDCVSLSAVAIGRYTHWWHGRTQPCVQGECAKCLSGSPRRWHSWLAVYSERSQRTYVLEVPAAAAKALADYRSKNATLRGVAITVHRANGKVNGPVRIGFGRLRGEVGLLPACPDVAALLERMWSARPGYDTAFIPATLALVQPNETQIDRRVGS